MKRGYLLPEGCKNLTDVANPWQQPLPKEVIFRHISPKTGNIILTTVLPEKISVKQLAMHLHRKPYEIIVDLLQLGLGLSAITNKINFESAAKVAGKYGYVGIKTPKN